LALLTGTKQLNTRAEGYALATLYNVGHDINACVIATAAQGTRMEHEIEFLKEFREKKLVRFTFGFHLPKLYYVFSAPLASLVARSDALMSIARVLLAPTVSVLKKIIR